jgi:hypothetical protein
MNLRELLEWISRNGVAAFLLGCFLLTLVGIGVDFFVKSLRSITGNYPPAPVGRLCDSDDPCYCCREGSCDEGCRCYPEQESDSDGGDARTTSK